MIKKSIFIFYCFCYCISNIYPQQLELHYDTRKTLYSSQSFANNYMSGTFELFKLDSIGSTFVLFDFNFSMSKGNLGMIYTEMARDLIIRNFPVMLHLEYNGGVVNNFTINNAFMLGGSYSFAINKFDINTYITYKLHTFEQFSHDIQWTLIWNGNLLENRLTISGFIDVWTENRDHIALIKEKKIILMSEPQVWYNITSFLSLGSEIRLSYNFINENKLYAIPTFGVKWKF